jgi:hypothetical protein
MSFASRIPFVSQSRRRKLHQTTKRRNPLLLKALEERVVMSSYEVLNISPSAAVVGSLGYEIAAAVSSNDTAAVITFSGVPSNSTIQLASADADATATTADCGPTAYFIDGNSGTNITIDGSGAPGLVIDGGSALRLFAVTSGNALTLENLTLQNGDAQGTAGFNGSFFSGSGGSGAGVGGAVFDNGGTFTALDSTFTNNSAPGGTAGAPSPQATINFGGGLCSPGTSGSFGEGGALGGNPQGGGGFGGFGGGGGGTGNVGTGNGGRAASTAAPAPTPAAQNTSKTATAAAALVSAVPSLIINGSTGG